ncbi:MAG: hypothetical protein KBT45_03270 [Bacteroidales bacterium]|nr:hypothetical protein [Candidatus Colimorpha pelethequi]
METNRIITNFDSCNAPDITCSVLIGMKGCTRRATGSVVNTILNFANQEIVESMIDDLLVDNRKIGEPIALNICIIRRIFLGKSQNIFKSLIQQRLTFNRMLHYEPDITKLTPIIAPLKKIPDPKTPTFQQRSYLIHNNFIK